MPPVRRTATWVDPLELIPVSRFGSTLAMNEEEQEVSYYRQVEDFFAGMRGVVHTLSPKDVQLLKRWWHEEVPFGAVVAGITEVFARRHAAGEHDPVVSLSFCRHAVRRHARRIAEMRLGTQDEAVTTRDGPASPATTTALSRLCAALTAVAQAQQDRRPEVASAIQGMLSHIRRSAELPASVIEEHLFSLELALLERCRAALPPGDRKLLEARADEAAALRDGDAGQSQRDRRALFDKAIRELLELPHLELEQ